MSQTLRDQLMGLGFTPAPAPEKSRHDRSSNETPGGGKSRRNGPAHARRDERGARGRDSEGSKGGQRPPGGARGADARRGEKRRGSGEMDLAKAYAIRSQTEKNERIAAEKERQEQAQRRREGKLKLTALLGTAALNDANAEIARHFEYGGKIRRVYATPEQLRAINAGELAVVQQGGRFFIVTPEHGRAAEALLAGALALLVDPSAPTADDPYADPQFQVPDDLVW